MAFSINETDQKSEPSRMFYYALLVVGVVALVALIFFARWASKVEQSASRISEQEPEVRTVITAACPTGELRVLDRWGLQLVGFCSIFVADGRMIVVRTVSRSGNETVKQFSETAAKGEDLKELRMWVARMQQVMSELGESEGKPRLGNPRIKDI